LSKKLRELEGVGIGTNGKTATTKNVEDNGNAEKTMIHTPGV